MNSQDQDIEACPKCGTKHTRGEYLAHQQGGKTIMLPHDAQCGCGLTLRWSVPIFRMTQSGYVLRILRDDEEPFIPVGA